MKNPHSSFCNKTTVGIYDIRNQLSYITPLFILIFPSILLRHIQKLFELLQPLRFHLPSIKSFSISFDPVEKLPSLLIIMFAWITMMGIDKSLHLLIPFLPPFILCHRFISFSRHHSLHLINNRPVPTEIAIELPVIICLLFLNEMPEIYKSHRYLIIYKVWIAIAHWK